MGSEESKAIVISRAGKSTGSYPYWWNVENCESKLRSSIDLSKVDGLRTIKDNHGEHHSTEDVLVVNVPRYLHKEPECLAAKETELKNWDQFGVYVEVLQSLDILR